MSKPLILIVTFPVFSLFLICCNAITPERNSEVKNTDYRNHIIGKWECRQDLKDEKDAIKAYATFKENGKVVLELSPKYEFYFFDGSRRFETNYRLTDSNTIEFFGDNNNAQGNTYRIVELESENIKLRTTRKVSSFISVWDECKFRKMNL